MFSFISFFRSAAMISNNSAFVMSLRSFRRYADQPVPDVSKWSVDDVVAFFSEAGFSSESEKFREQVRLPRTISLY